ncbi:2-hydroxyacid dehydrogenase [Babesia caballi]|uniref:2-hydroxyacid dehydrogenase n=1 Tax=Babesia caballi TaxID=5871 RepID=A0AAV4LTS6_BABCB|nr:2-hydroxyacid dehydrogenase [Babesia caballi]
MKQTGATHIQRCPRGVLQRPCELLVLQQPNLARAGHKGRDGRQREARPGGAQAEAAGVGRDGNGQKAVRAGGLLQRDRPDVAACDLCDCHAERHLLHEPLHVQVVALGEADADVGAASCELQLVSHHHLHVGDLRGAEGGDHGDAGRVHRCAAALHDGAVEPHRPGELPGEDAEQPAVEPVALELQGLEQVLQSLLPFLRYILVLQGEGGDEGDFDVALVGCVLGGRGDCELHGMRIVWSGGCGLHGPGRHAGGCPQAVHGRYSDSKGKQRTVTCSQVCGMEERSLREAGSPEGKKGW